MKYSPYEAMAVDNFYEYMVKKLNPDSLTGHYREYIQMVISLVADLKAQWEMDMVDEVEEEDVTRYSGEDNNEKNFRDKEIKVLTKEIHNYYLEAVKYSHLKDLKDFMFIDRYVATKVMKWFKEREIMNYNP